MVNFPCNTLFFAGQNPHSWAFVRTSLHVEGWIWLERPHKPLARFSKTTGRFFGLWLIGMNIAHYTRQNIKQPCIVSIVHHAARNNRASIEGYPAHFRPGNIPYLSPPSNQQWGSRIKSDGSPAGQGTFRSSMVWPQPRNLNGDASEPIITLYGGKAVD